MTTLDNNEIRNLQLHLLAIKSKHILDIIKNNTKIKELNLQQLSHIYNITNFTCQLKKYDGFGENDKYFKVILDNITLESYPSGYEQRQLKINGKIFIEEHHWYHDINNKLDTDEKNILIQMAQIINLTHDEYYEIISKIYTILLNLKLYDDMYL